MIDQTHIAQTAAHILNSAHFTIFTGAGASKESGIPTYREPREGIWAQHDPFEFATPLGFMLKPALAWQWHEYYRSLMEKAEPNPSHLAITTLQTLIPGMAMITANIDNLHERAKTREVIHLHGSAFRHKCFMNCQGDPTSVDISKLDYDPEIGPPKCPHCGQWVRPDVVWFGEVLPVDAVRKAKEIVNQTDVLLVIGLSGTITYNVPDIVKANGGIVIEVNPHQSKITPLADIWFSGPAGKVLPQIVSEITRKSRIEHTHVRETVDSASSGTD